MGQPLPCIMSATRLTRVYPEKLTSHDTSDKRSIVFLHFPDGTSGGSNLAHSKETIGQSAALKPVVNNLRQVLSGQVRSQPCTWPSTSYTPSSVELPSTPKELIGVEKMTLTLTKSW